MFFLDNSYSVIENMELIGILNNECSYLKDRKQSLYYYKKNRFSANEYRKLLDLGFRRSGEEVYQPVCNNCFECQIIRVHVNKFKRSKSQRRIWKHNFNKIDYKIVKPHFTIEKLKIYLSYLIEFHNRRYLFNIDTLFEEIDLEKNFRFNMLIQDYENFFVKTCLEEGLTKELNLFIENQLVGVGIIDIVNDVFSSVYFYFDPKYRKYSLGTFSIMLEIEIAKKMGLTYYYPGYYIENSPKMNYKKNFRPNEIKKIYEKNFYEFIK